MAVRAESEADAKGWREAPGLAQAARVRRVEAFFRAMSTDFLLREQFVTDPAQALGEYVTGASIPPESASVTNQFLYAVVSNRGLLHWLRDYALEHQGAPPARAQILSDFSRAVVQHHGQQVALALIRSSLEKEAVLGLFDEVAVQLLFTLGGIFADDPKTGGAEGGPGQTGKTGTGAPDGGTGKLDGYGLFGARYVLTLDALRQYAIQLNDAGLLDVAAISATTTIG